MRSDEFRLGAVARAVKAESFTPPDMLCSLECERALAWYRWEARVAAAFFELLRHLEKTLGHALSEQLTLRFGREDWWEHPGIGLHHVARRKIDVVLAKHARDRRRVVGPEDVRRELTLGFWVSLLGSGNDYETRLWRPALRHAFPAYRGPRVPLHKDLDHLRTLRNKVAHHEPIGSRDLGEDRRSVHRILGYLSADVQWWAEAEDRIPQVLTDRPVPCGGAIPRQRQEN